MPKAPPCPEPLAAQPAALDLSQLPEPALVVSRAGDVTLNAEARALGAERLDELWGPVVRSALAHGRARAVLDEPGCDRKLVASAKRLPDGSALLLLIDAREAVLEAEVGLAQPLVHELRNLSFALEVSVEPLGDVDGARGVRATRDRLTSLARALEEWATAATETPALYDVSQALRDAIDALGERGPSVTARGSAGAFGRRSRITRAFHLVLANAAQASPERGVEVRVEQGEDVATVSIRDRGPGLPRGAEVQAWTPLFRRRKKGIGLGLSTARRFVTDDGGSVVARNEPDGGATFVFTLPARPPLGPLARER